MNLLKLLPSYKEYKKASITYSRKIEKRLAWQEGVLWVMENILEKTNNKMY